MNRSSQPMSSMASSSETHRPRCAPGAATRHLAAWLAALACAAPATAQQAVSGDVVKIGVLTDMSGAYSDFTGSGAVIAAKMAIDDFSATGKVLGKPIEIVSSDHQHHSSK
jgi:ABC-type branched-subunit amino acid transport system substrate-binding protein